MKYDVIIVGAGPAGLAAAIYCARARLNTLLLEKGMAGGLIVTTDMVENYPGFPEPIGGMELTERMSAQAKRFGLEPIYVDVSAVTLKGSQRLVHTADAVHQAAAVIAASGSTMVHLGVPGEGSFTRRGVSWCATCDGFFFREKQVAVVGGGDAALTEALYLTRFADKVYLVHRRDQFRATKIMRERVAAEPKIEAVMNRVVTEIKGKDVVRSLALKDPGSGETSELAVDGVFIAVGHRPNTTFLDGVVALDGGGAVLVNEKMETSVPGIYAAGDVRRNSIRQVISAAGDGATAAVEAERYLAELGK